MVAAAERLGVTAGQVILRWHIEIGSLPIPKSATPSRQAENLDIFGFELTDDEVAAIRPGRGRRALVRGDPRTHEERCRRAIRVGAFPAALQRAD